MSTPVTVTYRDARDRDEEIDGAYQQGFEDCLASMQTYCRESIAARAVQMGFLEQRQIEYLIGAADHAAELVRKEESAS